MKKLRGRLKQMDDLHFPEGDIKLPPPKAVSLKAYVAFVVWQLNQMGLKKIRQELSRRPFPSGKRFTLFPDKDGDR